MLRIVFENKTILGNNFHFKYQIPKVLTSGIVCKFQCGYCNESYYGECVRVCSHEMQNELKLV